MTLFILAQMFAGIVGGVSTLSADGRSVVSGESIRISLYKPENGATAMAFAGWHFNDYLSAQGSYSWNRNDVTLTASQAAAFYEQPRTATLQTVAGELMLYFRDRRSFARPYLTAGGGLTRLGSDPAGAALVRGAAPPAPGSFADTKPALRVAVGIDLRISRGLAFRYSFSETIQPNAISEQLTPPGERNLANFQNLFGLMWRFHRF